MGSANDTSNLGKIVWKDLRKKWCYFCDVLVKVFYDKISNFDAIITSMQPIQYMLLDDKYYDLVLVIMYKLAAKLGSQQSRPKNIYLY